MALPQDFLQALYDRSDIVEIIGSNVSLRHTGRTYVGLCPFHNEKTPSFVVYPETQSFYCFGCGKGGDVVTYIKESENLGYIEAVRELAQRAGIPVPEDDSDNESFKRRRRILDANRSAAKFFFSQLNTDEGRNALKYLRGRGLTDVTIKKFGLGWAPSEWGAMRDSLKAEGFSEETLVESSLCGRSEKGNVYDFFHERVMFPVIDVRGNVVAFSGRTMGTDSRKYLNSRETMIFKKSRTLFALNMAKNTVSRRIIVAEGQMDVIAIHQAGFDNAVATLGTALTDEHVRMLSSYCDEVVLAYDGDEAGQKAVRRAIEVFRPSGIPVKVIHITGAKDPDEFINKYGHAEFGALVSGSNTSTEYQLQKAAVKYNLDTNDGRIRYLREATGIIAGLSRPTERDVYGGMIAGQTGVDKASVMLQIDSAIKSSRRSDQKKDESALLNSVGKRVGLKSSADDRVGVLASGRRLVALLYTNSDLCRMVKGRITPKNLLSEELGHIYNAIMQEAESGDFRGYSSLSPLLSNSEMALLTQVITENGSVNFSPDDLELYIDKILDYGNAPTDEQLKASDPQEIQKMIEKKKQREN